MVMKEFFRNNWFKVIIAIAVLMASISFVYRYFVYLPTKDKYDQSRLDKMELQKQLSLDKCLNDAKEEYSKNTKSILDAIEQGQFRGVSNIDKIFTDFESRLKVSKDECFRRFAS